MNGSVSVYVALLKREWLEHRTAFTVGPAILLILLLVFGLTVWAAWDNVEVEVSQHSSQMGAGEQRGSEGVDIVRGLLFDVAGSTDRELQAKLSRFLGFVGVPFYWVLTVIALFMLVSSLHDERKDQSILFWKSMPVNDLSTVLAKTVFITWLAPMVTVLGVFAAQGVALMFSLIFVEDGMGSRLLAHSGMLLQLPKLLLGYVLHGLWVLPVYAWFLLVASALPRSPLLWAIGGPWIVIILERIFFGTSVLQGWILSHIAPLAIPYASSSESVYTAGGQFQPFAILALRGLWGGLLVAAALLAATVYLRRRNNEV